MHFNFFPILPIIFCWIEYRLCFTDSVLYIIYVFKKRKIMDFSSKRLNSNFITYYFIMIKLIAQELIFNYVIYYIMYYLIIYMYNYDIDIINFIK